MNPPFPTGPFGVVLADPPWSFKVYSERDPHFIAKSAQGHYRCQSLDDIKALPVRSLLLPNAWVITWATAPMLPQAIEVLRAWGLTYVTAGAWAKRSSTGKKWAFGTGYVCRSAAEFFLIAKHGSPKVKSKNIRNLIATDGWEGPCIEEAIRQHSRKPDQQYELAEALGDGPYLELFSRGGGREGWSYFGDEAGKFVPGAAIPLFDL